MHFVQNNLLWTIRPPEEYYYVKEVITENVLHCLLFVWGRVVSTDTRWLLTNAWVIDSPKPLCFKTSRSGLQGEEEWSGQCGAASDSSNLLCGSVFVVLFCVPSTKNIKRQMEWKKELSFCGLFKAPLAFNKSLGCVLTFFVLIVCFFLGSWFDTVWYFATLQQSEQSIHTQRCMYIVCNLLYWWLQWFLVLGRAP